MNYEGFSCHEVKIVYRLPNKDIYAQYLLCNCSVNPVIFLYYNDGVHRTVTLQVPESFALSHSA